MLLFILLLIFFFQDDDLPTVMLALFLENATPYIKEFFERIAKLDYPKDKIDLYIHYNVSYLIGNNTWEIKIL